jgi:hypothetical protein
MQSSSRRLDIGWGLTHVAQHCHPSPLILRVEETGCCRGTQRKKSSKSSLQTIEQFSLVDTSIAKIQKEPTDMVMLTITSLL